MQWSLLPLMTLSLVIPPAGAWEQAPAHLLVTRESGEVLLDEPAPAGSRWCMTWNHSVEHFTVRDCYVNSEGAMVLERSHQPDFAAGLGHIEGRGVQVSDGEGGYWIEEIMEPVPGNRYALRVGAPAVDHRLAWPGGEYPTVSLSARAAGERVYVELTTP